MAALYTIGVFAVIFDADRRVLLCHRRDIDMWNLPGGGVESGELPTYAVIREVKEETGLDVAVGRLVGVYGKPDRDDLVLAFACDVIGGQLTETDESDACRYFVLDDIPPNTNPKQVERVYDATKPAGQPIFKMQEGPVTWEWLSVQRKYAPHLQKIFKIRAQIADIARIFALPLLTHVFPIAIMDADQFLIFDVDPSGKRYTFIKQAPTPMPIPQSVRAAFPLECYGGKPACVVTDDVFDTLDAYVTIFHEFVHCYQYQTCADKLKAMLNVARQAQAANDFMWEINYPFPYDAPDFVETYAAFLEAAAHQNYDDIRDCRARLRDILRAEDFEYMIWQEWKEGLARYIENRIKQHLDLPENHGGAAPPFDRVTFYEGGARLIAALTNTQPELAADIEKLFHRIEAGS
ncbi:MAG: NUDIX domain-containing protein [Anaerolineae bacterium]|nr:NUDIX domain-containing protein [Anaerolineae bacterium]